MSTNPTRFFVAIAIFRLFRNYGNILHPVLAFFMDLPLMIHPNSHIVQYTQPESYAYGAGRGLRDADSLAAASQTSFLPA